MPKRSTTGRFPGRGRRATVAAGGLAAALLASPAVSAAWPPPVPASLVMEVRETAGVTRTGEVISSGVPLPRSCAVFATTNLAVVDHLGTPVPAQFDVLARWHAPRDDPGAPIQWLLVSFAASVPAFGATEYRLVTDGSAGSNPPPPIAIELTRVGDTVTVNTGAATFAMGGDAGALFDQIRLPDGTAIVDGGTMSAIAGGAAVGHPTTRAVRIERGGPLAAVIVVEGAYDMAPLGGGGLGSERRYLFRAGSATAVVRHAIQWEGDRCGMDVLSCAGSPNAVRLTEARDLLSRPAGGAMHVTAIGAFDGATVAGTAAPGDDAWVRQSLRPSRLAPLSYDVHVPGTGGSSGTKADGGVLAVDDGATGVAIALDHMHRYEPQALRLLASNDLAADLAGGDAWLGNHQGMFATLAVSVFTGAADRAALEALLWAPLNRPLRAWPTAEWWTSSEAVNEVVVGNLPADLAAYDTLVEGVLDDTLTKIDERGLPGLMTFGVYPRIWGHPWYDDELECDDPTPADAWDEAYWCGTWTDYHDTIATAPIWAMRSGAVEWLDEISRPGALRTLYTQIIRCAPGEAFFYCGQAPTGYGGYRADNNASHGYFDNLILYYWLTGDSTVVTTLRRGAENMRRFVCASRGPGPVAEPSGPDGPACAPDDPLPDSWAGVTGRVASQWHAVFRLVGLASADASFLEDYAAGPARALTRYWVQPTESGRDYGFLFSSGDGVNQPVTGPGTRRSNQLWMVSLYDMNVIQRLAVDTGDAPLGNPARPPSEAEVAWADTVVDLAATITGDGTATGVWPNQLEVTWSGPRIGGALDQVAADVDPDGNGVPCDAWLDECLYPTGKAILSAAAVRAADLADDDALRLMGRELTTYGIANALAELSPLGKIEGEYLARLHAAVARLAWHDAAPSVIFRDDFEAGTTAAWSATVPGDEPGAARGPSESR